MDDRTLVELAFQAREQSYSPYSHFKVGAALLCKNGEVYKGCNIESCSYTPTNCAERTAFFKAVSEGEREFDSIAVVGGPESEGDSLSRFAAPCGVCRQLMYEFCSDDFRVILARSAEDFEVYTLRELLPMAFTPNSL